MRARSTTSSSPTYLGRHLSVLVNAGIVKTPGLGVEAFIKPPRNRCPKRERTAFAYTDLRYLGLEVLGQLRPPFRSCAIDSGNLISPLVSAAPAAATHTSAQMPQR